MIICGRNRREEGDAEEKMKEGKGCGGDPNRAGPTLLLNRNEEVGNRK